VRDLNASVARAKLDCVGSSAAHAAPVAAAAAAPRIVGSFPATLGLQLTDAAQAARRTLATMPIGRGTSGASFVAGAPRRPVAQSLAARGADGQRVQPLEGEIAPAAR
jgi:hypothetical protein